MTLSVANLLTWTIAGLSVVGVVARPFRWPEAVWPVVATVVLLALGLLPLTGALKAIGKGADVYLFLIGMMLLSEIARREGLFDCVASLAVNLAKRSPARLFLLVFMVGVVVTAFLSNDATAVVLTPAVFAAARKARADPLPLLFICAFVANAASFVLPISNPANLVLYGGHTPQLASWLTSFALPSLAATLLTYGALRWAERSRLEGGCLGEVEQPKLTSGGWTALAGIGVTACALLAVSALGLPLGLPTCLLGAVTVLVVLVRDRQAPWPVLKGVSWSILPLVAGLFVIVEAVSRTGLIALLARVLGEATRTSQMLTATVAGVAIAVASNLINNLPAGLVASSVLHQAHPAKLVTDALLIGVDLGPNLSVTGSLATILWLIAIRREGEHVGFWRFLKVGALVMPPALIAAIGARLLLG